MAEYIAIPKLGMSMTEATLVEWRLKEGDHVEKGEIVLVIETEKTKWEVEAATAGFVHIMVNEDVIAPVGRVVGLIATDKEELVSLQKESPKEIFTTVPEVSETSMNHITVPAPVNAAAWEKTIRISPVARKIAEENMIDIATIVGTGPDGRIVREDIERAIEVRKEQEAARTISSAVYEGRKVKTTIPLKGMRRAIAEHMQRSLSVSAQLTSMGEIDMTEMVKVRNSLVEQEQELGTRITYTDIFVLAAARVLKEYPIVNSSLVGNEINLWEEINIGVAVAVEEGLIVPVVKNADHKSLVEISLEVKTLVEKARVGKLMPDDVAEGTFTITNLGAYGGGYGFGTPIINQPQVAILGIGAITERPVVRQGQIVIRSIMTYSFTFDHRVLDGAPAGRFLDTLTQLLENPSLLQL